jgi:FAD/FMN-containing dehydrogenase
MTSCHIPPVGFRGAYRSDDLARAIYSEAAGIGRIIPAAVAVPQDADDVITLVKWAKDRSLSLVPRGSGSSMANGAIGPGVVVDLSRMNAINNVDLVSHSIWAGPGAIRGDIDRVAHESGLRFPVDPSSGEFCTIGGMVSTNAAGARTLRFGATRDWIIALDCVFEDGSRAVVSRIAPTPTGIPALDRFIEHVDPRMISSDALLHRGVAKDSSGYGVAAYAHTRKLIDLLVGSEGTLAIIVGVQLGLAPLARKRSSVLGTFASLDAAVIAAATARTAGAVACELLEKTFLDVASSGGSESTVAVLQSIPENTQAVLLAEVEGANDHEAEEVAHGLARAFTSSGASLTKVALGTNDQHEIWELRHAASPILGRLDPALKSMQFIEDGAVPVERLADYVNGVKESLAKWNVRGVIFGHAGDAHVHVNPLVDVSKADWRRSVEGILSDVVNLTAQLGGTLSGEHGDGRLRTPLLAQTWSEAAIDLFREVKAAFDPAGILNPGVKIPLSNQSPIGDIKYDPLLPALPPQVRRALDSITDKRAYSTFRLSLIPESH